MEGNCRKEEATINPISSSITKEQLTKFKELQRRRLQIASKSKFKKKHKRPSDVKDNILNEDLDTTGSPNESMEQGSKDSTVGCNSKNDDMNERSSFCSQADVHPAFRKKKLHWGLDTKERWERKANM